MLENHLRQYYQTLLLNPFANLIQSVSNPMWITALAAITGLAIVPAMIEHDKWLAIGLLLLSGFFDTLDGTIARMTNQTSQFGTVCDIIADRIVECSVIIGLYLYAPQTRSLACLVLLAIIMLCLVSFLLNGMFTDNNTQKGFYYNIALVERFEAFIFFILMILFPQYFHILCYTLSLLIGITVLQHVITLKRTCDASKT